MSRPCGHLMVNGQACTHMVADPARPDCGRHLPTLPSVSTPPNTTPACTVRQIAAGVWRCTVHDGPEWDAAEALGAHAPCELPLSPVEQQILAEGDTLDLKTAWMLARGNGSPRALALLAHRQEIPAEMLAYLAERSDSEILMEVANHPSTPPTVLAQLSEAADWRVRGIVAANINTPVTALEQLLADGDSDVCIAAVRNPRVSQRLLQDRLKTETIGEVLAAIAVRLDSPESLDSLSRSANSSMRRAVASNENTDPQVLGALAFDSFSEVRRAVARNECTPATALEDLAADSSGFVREAVASNPVTPDAVLRRMLDERMPPEDGSLETVRICIARRHTIASGVLSQLASDQYPMVRREVASNANTSASDLELLARDSTPGVRHRVALNPHAPAELLRQLARQADPVGQAARSRLQVSETQTPS